MIFNNLLFFQGIRRFRDGQLRNLGLKVAGTPFQMKRRRLLFPSPAWAARVPRQGRERASFPSAKPPIKGSVASLRVGYPLSRPSATLSPQEGEGKNGAFGQEGKTPPETQTYSEIRHF
jgi:hypothetical protein